MISDPQVPARSAISQEVLLAVLDRCDETRDFLVAMWQRNPQLAKQGGQKVALMLNSDMTALQSRHEPSRHP